MAGGLAQGSFPYNVLYDPLTKIKRVTEKVFGVKGKNHSIYIDQIDYGAYLKKNKGEPPSDMYDPHAHHIVLRKEMGKLNRN
ncbi:hypothetical protein [Cytobacillus oceanisediminis]|uniref:hypothetical protein n=1 Tax=Cytobacillus oceanisediminis TaxID=665099 RepID=UPI0008D8ED94|nr:hypothetical protein [Cytobacillus oceanisediminis]MCM3391861.1 hypothetical protein [Cytobacillus oceanisediminis]